MLRIILSASCLLVFMASCSSTKKEETPTDQISFKIVKVFPHDPTSYIQGLVIYNGNLFESTGREGSWISKVDIASGKQEKKVILDDKYFGEGITILNNKIFQLTWQHKIGFVYKLSSFEKIGEFTYDHEGWGITHNGKQLIVSDGTNKIHFLDTLSLKETRSINVQRNGEPMDNLNELEFIEGFIFANQYQTNYILKINPETGDVAGVMDMTSLHDEVLKFDGNPEVLNGIAYEPKSKTLLITGKLWPVLFALKLNDKTTVQQ